MKSLARTLIVTTEEKGGVAKSTTSALVTATAEKQELKVRSIDSDTGNSSTAQAQADAYFIDLSNEEASGHISAMLEDISNGVIDCANWDTGAREEKQVLKILTKIGPVAHRLKIPIIIIRPITTNHFVQGNALNCVSFARSNGFAIIFATILAQGRKEEDMTDWRQSISRSIAVKYAVEIDVESMGAIIGDNASSFSMSLSDVALGRFDGVPEDYREKARAKFTRPRQMFMAGYLETMSSRIELAVDEARKRIGSQIDRKKVTP